MGHTEWLPWRPEGGGDPCQGTVRVVRGLQKEERVMKRKNKREEKEKKRREGQEEEV